jgi:hypothetical protein
MADDQKQPGGFKSFLQHAMPFISAGLSVAGPMGSLAGNVLSKALGTSAVPTTLAEGEQAYAAALSAAGAPADIIEKAKEAERNFKLQCEQMNIDSVEKILALENADRADARAREVQAKDKTPEIGFYLLTFIVAAIVVGLLKYTVPADNKAVLFMFVGSVGSAWMASVTYFYGTSRGSERKTELLAAADQDPK